MGPIVFGGLSVVALLYREPAGVYPLSGSARHTLSHMHALAEVCQFVYMTADIRLFFWLDLY